MSSTLAPTEVRVTRQNSSSGAAAQFLAAEDVASVVRPGDTVVIGHGGGWPRQVVEGLVHGARTPLRIVHNRIDDALPYFEGAPAGNVRHAGFMAGHTTRRQINAGAADFIPNAYGLTPSLLRSGAVSCDVAVLHVSPPDADGWCSLGTCVAYLPAAASRARVLIAQVNEQMPRSRGTLVHVSAFDYVVEVNDPLQTVQPARADVVTADIARAVAALIDSGDTVQLGIGKLGESVLHGLACKAGIRLHTETFGDAALGLLADGTLRGGEFGEPAITATFVTGGTHVYDMLESSPDILMLPVDQTNSPTVLGSIDRFVAVNSAIEIDLTGQINAESIGPRLYSGPGGHLDFAIGAAYGPRGRYICALPSVAAGGATSRIVPTLAQGSAVTVPRSLADVVVTEFGVAHLRGRSMRERAKALAEIAHPNYRSALRRAATNLSD